MRLRLNILRHQLPPTLILWDTNGSVPGQDSGDNATVAELLQQVNHVIPLECEDEGWDLEDYAVDCHRFECLHFMTLRSILREDDFVT